MEKINKTILPATILVSSIILGGFYYGGQLSKQNSKKDVDIKIETPIFNKITLQNKYSINCSSIKYTAINIGGFLIPESSINISDGSEKQVLYVENKKAKYFGAEYDVLQDDEFYLVIIRSYEVSGLTEVISINKESGIGFDTNTKTLGMTGGPTTATYLISCSQI